MCAILFWSEFMYKDEYYMFEALKLAKKAYRKNEIPVGAVIVYKNKIISKAFNKKDRKKIVTKHAEIIAIEKANKKLKDWRICDATMYVTMEPCPMCAGAIQQSRIKRIVYGCNSNNPDNFKIIKQIMQNKNYNHRVEITEGILNKECAKLIKLFFKTKRI